jgi:hypothetical protein
MTYSLRLSFRLKNAVRLAVALFFFLGGIASWAQTADHSAAPISAGPQQSREEEAWEAQQRKKMAAEENAKRQQELRKDTAKLLQLATELKQYVDKTNENMLSVEVIQKAEEIEKLARSVKEKMKGP